MTSNEYQQAYNNGICPKCNSTNTRKNRYHPTKFWGCNECGYGHWEKLTSNSIDKLLYEDPEVEQYLKWIIQHRNKTNDKDVQKIKTTKATIYKDGTKQLSLF